MRKPFIAGNWKMNLLSTEAAALADLVREVAAEVKVEVGIAPPFTALAAVAGSLEGSNVRLLAQDLHWEDSGAFTGEVSASMLRDLGCTHVIIGHSERRQYFGETDASVNKKLQAAFKHGLTPILCIGETQEERDAGQTHQVLERQIRGGCAGFEPARLETMVIAYEPVWAIGKGKKPATTEQAQEAHVFIRALLANLYSQDLAAKVRIQYGGNVNPGNVKQLMAVPDIDGALVGGASLKPDTFIPIIKYQA